MRAFFVLGELTRHLERSIVEGAGASWYRIAPRGPGARSLTSAIVSPRVLDRGDRAMLGRGPWPSILPNRARDPVPPCSCRLLMLDQSLDLASPAKQGTRGVLQLREFFALDMSRRSTWARDPRSAILGPVAVARGPRSTSLEHVRSGSCVLGRGRSRRSGARGRWRSVRRSAGRVQCAGPDRGARSAGRGPAGGDRGARSATE